MGKRGPKAKPGKRWKNGRLSRTESDVQEREQDAFDKEARDTMSVAVEARQRLYGLTETRARDPLAGSVVGRMYQSRTLTAAQYLSALNYIRDVSANRHAIDAPKEPGAVDLNRVHGLPVTSDAGWEDWANKARSRYADMEYALRECQNHHGNRVNLWGALDVFCFREVYVANLEGDFRIALNALARHYGLVGIVAA